MFTEISEGYSCNQLKTMIRTDADGRNETFVKCVLQHLDINSLNQNAFELNFNKTAIAIIKNLTENFFENNTYEKNFVLEMKIKNSHIRLLPSKLFKGAPKLETLDVSNVGLRILYANSLTNAGNLNQLDLHGNQLKRVENFCFVHAENIKSLDLSNNLISNIGTKAFEALDQLEKLVLDNNHISILNDEVFYPLKGLRSLHLDRNQITIIPSRMFTKVHSLLHKIFFNGNRINEISPYAFDELENLQYLMLTGNGCINRDFVNHKIAGNVGVKYEIRRCIKNFKKVMPGEFETLSPKQKFKDLVEKRDECIFEENQLKQLVGNIEERLELSKKND